MPDMVVKERSQRISLLRGVVIGDVAVTSRECSALLSLSFDFSLMSPGVVEMWKTFIVPVRPNAFDFRALYERGNLVTRNLNGKSASNATRQDNAHVYQH